MSRLNTPENAGTDSLSIRDCGRQDYRETLELQYELRDKRRTNAISDTVLLVEHNPVITLGANKSKVNLLADIESLRAKGIDVVEIRRGGGATAHNPGQLVFYPILDLRKYGLGISEYIRLLERIGTELLREFGVDSEARKGYPGLWSGGSKIASIGVRVSKFITFHGMAININNDLSIFDYMVPCGIEGVEMTSASKLAGEDINMDKLKRKLSEILMNCF
jgi:lipoate-protein ligase B